MRNNTKYPNYREEHNVMYNNIYQHIRIVELFKKPNPNLNPNPNRNL